MARKRKSAEPLDKLIDTSVDMIKFSASMSAVTNAASKILK